MNVDPDPKNLDAASRRDPSRERVRKTLLGAFLALTVVMGVFAAATSLGVLKLAAIVTTLGLAIVAALDVRLYWLPRLILVLAMTYVTALMFNVGLWALFHRVDKQASTQGMLMPDSEVGFRLQPDWKGIFNDGVVRNAKYEINGLGHRDANPAGDALTRVLLVGDSFTFGSLLDQEETIDRQLEVLTGDAVDAYNLGVPGYGAQAAAHALTATTVSGKAVIYLFYENDLRNDGLATERNTVHQGFLVQSFDKRGQKISEAELDAELAWAKSPLRIVGELVTLRHVVQTVNGLLDPYKGTPADPIGTSTSGPLGYDPKNVPVVVGHTLAMKSLAESRGMSFVVLLIPSLHEALAGHYDDRVIEYAEALGHAGVATIHSIASISDTDYYAHDGHFNPNGAKKAARAILPWVRDVVAY